MREVDVGVRYVLQTVDRGLRQAIGLTSDFSKQTRTSTKQVDAALRASDTAWRRTASIAARAQRQVADEQIRSATKVNSSLERQVVKLHKAGVGYKEIAQAARGWGATARETAAAVEKASAKEIAALDRVIATRNRLRHAVGLGPGGATRGMGAEDRSLERGALGAGFSKARLGAASLGGGLLAGIAGYVGVSAVKDSVDATKQLALETRTLSAVTGMDAKTAAEWVAITQARNISSRTFGMSLKTLSTQTVQAMDGSKKSVRAFTDLGISYKEVKQHSHDLSGMLGLVADHLDKMPGGVRKTADASQLLGRNWMALQPVLLQGSKGMAQQRQEAAALGVTLGGNAAENAKKLEEASVKLKIAQLGLEVQFAEHVAPAVMKVVGVGIKLFGVLRKELGPAVHFVTGEVKDASHWLGRHKDVLHGVEIGLAAVTAGFVGLKVINTGVRLVRGISNDFRTLANVVKAPLSLFKQQRSESVQLAESNDALAKANARLAASFDEVAASAKAAAGGEAMADEAAMGGGGAMMPGGKAMAAEKGAGAGMATARQAEQAGASLTNETQQLGMMGMLFGREGTQSLLSRLTGGLGVAAAGLMGAQMIGGAVGGKTGSAISTIGSGAAAGAGIGMIGGVPGAIAGGLLGGGIAALTHFVGPGGPQFHINASTAAGTPTISSLDQLQKQMASAAQAGNFKKLDFLGQAAAATAKGFKELGVTDLSKKLSGLSSAASNVSKGLSRQVAAQRIGGLETQLATSKYKPSAGGIAGATVQQLKGLPAQTQRMGAEAMIKFTAGLEAQRKLPVGTTDKLIKDLDKRYGPLLQKRLQADSATSMKVIADTIKQSKVVSTVQQQVDEMNKEWGLLIPDTKLTGQNIVKTMTDDMGRLRSIIKTSTGQQRADAEAEYKKLEVNTSKYFASMFQTVKDRQGAMTNAVSSSSQQAYQIGSKNFQSLAHDIAQWIGSGATATAQGLKNITDQVNATLKQYGEAPLAAATVKALSAAQLAAVVSGQVSSGAAASRHATGGRVPGSVGPDTWTLVDPAGRAAAKVAGRELLIANRHTELDEARDLAHVRAVTGISLPTIGERVSGERRPHSLPATYATGGLARYATGGLGSPGASSPPGYVFPFPKGEGFSWQRIDQGQDLQGPPGGPVVAIGPGVVSVGHDAFSGFGPFYPIEQMTAGPFAGRGVYYGHVKDTRTGPVQPGDVIGVTQSAANTWTAAPAGWLEIGFTSALGQGIQGQGAAIAPELHALAAGHMVPGIGGGGAAVQIQAPKVHGGGVVGKIAQAALNKTVAAANKLLASKAGAAGAAGMGSVAGPLVTASWFDDPQTASGHVHVPGFAELSNPPGSLNFSALGHLPMGEIIQVGYHGRSISIPKVDVGAGGSAIPPATVRGIDLTREAANMLPGFIGAGLSNVTWRDTGRKAFAQGGHVDYAGAFGGGGAFTAHRPTMAMFGDNGEEHVFAIPKAQLGHPGLGWPSPPTKHKTPHPRPHHPKAPAGPHLSTALNPITDKVETHTASDWQLIRAEAAKQRHDAAAAKKKYDAWLAQQVTDMLKVGGMNAGSIDLTRKQANQAHLPLGHPFQLLGRGINMLTTSGFGRVSSGLQHQLDINNLGQTLHLADVMNRQIGRGADRGLFRQQGGLTRHLASLEAHAERATKQRDRIFAQAQAAHGKRHQKLMIEWGKLATEVQKDRQAAVPLRRKLAQIGDKIAVSRPAQIENRVISAALKGITSQVSNQQSQFDHDRTIAGLLEGAAPGSTLKGLGLSPMMLRAAGLTRSSARRLIGKGADTPAAYAAQVSELTKSEIPKYEQDAKHLQNLYQHALKTHNKKLQGSLLKQLDAVTQAVLQAQSDLRQAQVQAIEGKAQAAVDKTTHASALAASGQQGLSIAQQLGGITGAIADRQNADYVTKAILPSLKNELGALQSQEAAAKQVGDSTLADQIAEAIAGKQNDILQAQLDVQNAIKQATEDAAQATVDTANHVGAMADTGLQRLELQQQLSGTAGTPGGAQQISAYINSQILPALQGELTALQGQKAAAQAVGDTTLATQIAEAIAGKQNDILQAQLDAQTAIKDATQSAAKDLSELGGDLGVSYGGQQLPDLAGMLNGA